MLVLPAGAERDRAKALLRESIDTLEGANRAVAQGNLATLLMDEGKLAEALEMYESGIAVYRQIGAHQQLAARLNNMSIIQQQLGNYDAAIELQNESLGMVR